jgi:hypothetical protein
MRFLGAAVPALALAALIASQWVLTAYIHGTSFDGGDGKMAQAMVLTALRFTRPFEFTAMNPVEGLGSQLFPINVWLNPTYWPFAFLERSIATDVATLIALTIFAISIFGMATCFNVPRVAAIVGAQASIILFPPLLFVFGLSTVFSLMPGNAVVYAPFMVALGLLARLQPGSWRLFSVTALAICALLFYSLCCDPLWFSVSAWNWAIPFAVVTFGTWRFRDIMIRCLALAASLPIFVLSGAVSYVLTLAMYTARVQFGTVVRARAADFNASALFYSPAMKYLLLVCALGWAIGLVWTRDRSRLFVITGIVSAAGSFVYLSVYLYGTGNWHAPLPVYVEQGLTPLFLASAAIGYWGALQRFFKPLAINAVAATCLALVIPLVAADFAVNRSGAHTETYNERWPNEPELARFFYDRLAQDQSHPFRGAVMLGSYSYAVHLRAAGLWSLSVPTIDEYGQLATPQLAYFALKDRNGNERSFAPPRSLSWQHYYSIAQLLGIRYHMVDEEDWRGRLGAEILGYRQFVLPQRPHDGNAEKKWIVYELPHPNLGNYSATEIKVADTADKVYATIFSLDFDPTQQAVLSTEIADRLTPASEMRIARKRGALHVSGHSNGISLVVLPQQFSHCLKARNARLLRTDLILTGILFSGDLDTDVVFDYGVFHPGCRWEDLADLKRLGMTLP